MSERQRLISVLLERGMSDLGGITETTIQDLISKKFIEPISCNEIREVYQFTKQGKIDALTEKKYSDSWKGAKSAIIAISSVFVIASIIAIMMFGFYENSSEKLEKQRIAQEAKWQKAAKIISMGHDNFLTLRSQTFTTTHGTRTESHTEYYFVDP